MRFEFATATRILFGAGVVGEIDSLAPALGRNPLLVTGRDPSRAYPVRDALERAGLEPLVQSVHTEPTVEWLREAVQGARKESRDCVISFGGGSAIDAGKAVAALVANPGDPLDYLEVIGRGQPLRSPSAPFIAVPTTAGTGAEVTRNAVLGSPEHGVKASLRSAGMLPTVAIVDPELTLGLPPHLTAQTGLDALTQLIEPFVCRKANPITDAFCRQGIPLVVRSLQQAFADGTDLRARTDMALASLLGGLALANAGLGAVHGFAAPIGGMFPAPHGAVCATILPHAMKANIEALRKRDPHGPGLVRFQELAELITGDRDAAIEDGLAWVQTLCQDLRVPGLSQWGVRVSDGPELAMKAARANSMKANPIDLAEGELVEILERALG